MQTPSEILKSVFGYESFRGQQEPVIERILSGKDALVLMPTGSGKSLCYQIPALIRDGVAVIISPLIALMKDQVLALEQAGVSATALNSSMDSEELRRAEDRMASGTYRLVYVAPERFKVASFIQCLKQTPVSLFAVDEAHCVSQWGHDFRPEYRRLDQLRQWCPEVPLVALTATADEPTRKEILDHLGIESTGLFVSGFDRPNIYYRVVEKDRARDQLWDFIQTNHRTDAGIIYCMSRRKVDELTAWLVSNGHTALAYHAGLDKGVRTRNQERFLNEDGIVIVATIAFGMGIDKPNVRFVAHMDLPKSLEAYYQETGRAGRDGKAANAWMCYGYGDAALIRQMVERSEAPLERKRLEQLKLNALLGYCETAQCRRGVLLTYFGEVAENACNHCDTCEHPVETFDGTTVAQKALSNIYRTGQRFGAQYLTDVLLGAPNKRLLANRHDRASTYGIGEELDRHEWMSVYRQLIAAGLVDVEPAHGGLRLSDKASPILKGTEPVQLRRQSGTRRSSRATGSGRATQTGARAAASSAGPVDMDGSERRLFDALRAKRLEISRAAGLPPFVIFHDKTLLEMTRLKPRSLEAMAAISGVGERKLETYGETFLKVIEKAVES